MDGDGPVFVCIWSDRMPERKPWNRWRNLHGEGDDRLTVTDPVKENTGDNGSVNSVTSGSEGSSEGVLDKIGDDIRDGADQAGDDIGDSVREDAAQISEGMDGDTGTQP